MLSILSATVLEMFKVIYPIFKKNFNLSNMKSKTNYISEIEIAKLSSSIGPEIVITPPTPPTKSKSEGNFKVFQLF